MVVMAGWLPPLREEGPQVPSSLGVPDGTDDGAPNAVTPADASPSSLSGPLMDGEWPSPGGSSEPVKAGKTDAKSTPKIGTSSSPSMSGRCSECKNLSRCGFLCKHCGKRVIPFPVQAKPSAQGDWIPF